MMFASNEHLRATPPHANVFKWASIGYFSFTSLMGREIVIVLPLQLGLRLRRISELGRRNMFFKGEKTQDSKRNSET